VSMVRAVDHSTGVTLAILAGGNSERMGQDKARMPFLGRPLILRILERLRPLADEVMVTTSHPEDFAFLEVACHPDLVPGRGALGGLYTALSLASNPIVAAVGCDLPFANLNIFQYACDLMGAGDYDVVVPSTDKGLEPLHAVYHRDACLPVARRALDRGDLKLINWFPTVKTLIIGPQETAKFDQSGLAFWNLNTPEEFRQAEERAGREETC
jgi:molybdopterin-guanine dinucleotide biosynthesis protein A